MLQTLSLRYDPVHDRLLMRMVVKDDAGISEHFLHLTRRVCASWRQDLQAMVDLSAQAPDRLDAPAKAAVSSAHHQAMASQAKVRTETVTGPVEMPTEPALITQVICGRRRNDGRWVVKFELLNKATLTLVLSGQTLHGLVESLNRRLHDTGWTLPALAVETKPATPAIASQLH